MRSVTPYALRIALIKITEPPRQIPVSMKSPGTPSFSTVRMQSWTLSGRLAPNIVRASAGQEPCFPKGGTPSLGPLIVPHPPGEADVTR